MTLSAFRRFVTRKEMSSVGPLPASETSTLNGDFRKAVSLAIRGRGVVRADVVALRVEEAADGHLPPLIHIRADD